MVPGQTTSPQEVMQLSPITTASMKWLRYVPCCPDSVPTAEHLVSRLISVFKNGADSPNNWTTQAAVARKGEVVRHCCEVSHGTFAVLPMQ